jgi:glycosyltransferase involved in cell wall biosynthesis
MVPNYNHAHHIKNQLNAILSQSVRPLEVIVVDDGSTDDSVAVIEQIAQTDPIVRLIRNERNRGVVATINRGLEACRGEFFYGAGADDLVSSGLFERIEGMIDRHPQAGIYFGMFRAIDEQDRELCVAKPSRWTEETFVTPEMYLNEYLEVEHCIVSSSPATVYRKRYLEEIGGFREELGSWCDSFALRAIALKYGGCYTPHVLATYRCPQVGFSHSQVRNPRLMMDITARAAWLMRSPELRDRFPESHVTRWERAARDYYILQHHLRLRESAFPEREGVPPAVRGPSGIGRRLIYSAKHVWFRLLASYHWRRLRAHVPDLSCYPGASR